MGIGIGIGTALDMVDWMGGGLLILIFDLLGWIGLDWIGSLFRLDWIEFTRLGLVSCWIYPTVAF